MQYRNYKILISQYFQSIIPDFHSWAINAEQPPEENQDKKLNNQNKHDSSPAAEQGAQKTYI